MNPQTPNLPSANPPQPDQRPPGVPSDIPVDHPMPVMQAGERVVCEIKRHPIGLFGIYGMIGFVLVVLAIVVFAVIPSAATSSASQATSIAAVFFLVVAALCLGFTFIANKVYWGNRWIITSDSLTQVTQSGLFSTQTSQLSLANLEDVTTEQNGLFTHMFNYGVLKAETAGEHSKFTFLYCPNPNHYAQEILNARELFAQSKKNGV